MSLTPSQRLIGLGSVLLAALMMCSHNFAERGDKPFLIPLAIAGIAYLLAVRELFAGKSFSRQVLVFGLALAAIWHVLFLVQAPGADDDIHRYLWDGRVQRLGYNPLVVIPSDPALAGLHTPATRTMNHPEMPSPYPPGAQLFFRAVVAVHESVVALKLAFVLCDVLIVLVLLDLLRLTGQPEHWVLAYAWHPLLAVEVAGSGHVDIVGMLLLVISVAALARRWRALAAVAFGSAIAVKFLPIVLLPLYWKRVRVRDAALAALVVVLLYLPFLDHGRIPFGSLGTYVHSFRFNAPVFTALERAMSPELIAGIALLVGLMTAVWIRMRFAEISAESFAWPMTASLLCAPVIYPWYLLWPLPFLRSRATLPITIWTVSIIPTYWVWHLRATGRLWILPDWIMVLEYGAVAVAAAITALRSRRVASPQS